MPKSRQRVVVISPTYNEKGNISKLCKVLLDDVFSKLNKTYDPHILIVDDSSPDGTGQEVLRLAKQYPNLHLLTNPKKMGLGNAYTKGMKYALNTLNADIVFEFDADFQHDPKLIPLMLTKMEEGYDLVLGSRYISGGSIPESWGLHRKFLSVFGNIVIRIVITDFSIHDWTTGFRAIRRHVVEAVLPELTSDNFMGYTFQIGFLHKATRKKFKIGEVPLQFIDRTYGKSKLGTEYVKNTLIYIFKVRIKEIIHSRVFKFATVGAFGALVQLVSLYVFRNFLPYAVANLAAIEMAIISNFAWNNLWTFADKTISAAKIPLKFLQFNMASSGSILIQELVAISGQLLFGLFFLFSISTIEIDTGMLYAVIGIGIGMIWNYFAYSKLIWKTK
jgi:dolichol-phosphate mannosyltransferase